MLKKFKKAVLITAIGACLYVPAVNAEDSNFVKININGAPTDLSGTIVYGRTMVPLRAVCEKMGLSVLWEKNEKKITLVSSEKRLEMKLGEYKINIDGHEKNIDTPPQLIGESTYVPLRFLSENMGNDVSYDDSTRTAAVNSIEENSIVIHTVSEVKSGDIETDFQFPVIEGLKDSKVQEKINDIFKKHVEDFKLVISTFEKDAREWSYDTSRPKYAAAVNYDIKYNKNNLLSVVFTDYTYMGGAHGMYDNVAYTVDLVTGEVYNLEDVFISGSDYEAVINGTVKEEFDKFEYKLQEFESISDAQPYYLDDKGFVVYFGLYEYTAYAQGIPEVIIPYGKLDSMIKVENLKSGYLNQGDSVVKNEAQQKKIMENLSFMIDSKADDAEVKKFIAANMQYMSEENASQMKSVLEGMNPQH